MPYNPDPLIYKATTGWKIFFVVVGLAMTGGGLVGVWFLARPSQDAVATYITWAFVTGSLIFALLGVWCAFYAIMRKNLILKEAELQYPSFFKTITVRRADIAGYRILANNGINMLIVESKSTHAVRIKKHSIELLFKQDEAFWRWFEGIPNLDFDEYQASLEEIAQDERLGDTAEARFERIQKAKRWESPLMWIAIPLFFVGFILPDLIILVVLIALPWLSLLLSRISGGAFAVYDPGKNSPRADITGYFLLPPLLLVLKVLKGPQLINPYALMLPSLVGTLLFLVITLKAEPIFRAKAYKFVMLIIIALAYSSSTIAITNRLFDQSRPTHFRRQVLEKRSTSSKSASYFLTLSAWGPFPQTDEYDATYNLYSNTAVNDSVCIHLYSGVFGLEWYDITSGDSCQTIGS